MAYWYEEQIGPGEGDQVALVRGESGETAGAEGTRCIENHGFGLYGVMLDGAPYVDRHVGPDGGNLSVLGWGEEGLVVDSGGTDHFLDCRIDWMCCLMRLVHP